MIIITENAYIAFDWHDWTQCTHVLKNKNGIDFTGKDCEEEILNKYFENEKSSIDIKNTAKAMKRMSVNDTIEIDDATTITKPEENVYKFAIYDEVTSEFTYEILDDQKEEIVYLPVRQYICFPKYTPVIERCFCKPFKTYKEAASYIENQMPDLKTDLCERIEDIVCPVYASLIENNTWYLNQAKIFENYTREEMEKAFLPYTDTHLIALKLHVIDAVNTDNRRMNITAEYDGKIYKIDNAVCRYDIIRTAAIGIANQISKIEQK